MNSKKSFILFSALLFVQTACSRKEVTPDFKLKEEVIFEGTIKKVNLTSLHHDGTIADHVNFVIEAPSLNALLNCFHRAGWTASDKLTFVNLSREVKDIVQKKDYFSAPFSPLYLFGHSQDLGFEIEVENTPRQRHHIRLWKSLYRKADSLLWFGAATFDMGVNWLKLTHTTSPDLNTEESFTSKTFLSAQCSESITPLNSEDPTQESLDKTYLVKIK